MNTEQLYDNFIDGSLVSGAVYKANINPSNTEDIIGQYAVGTAGDVDSAFQAARRAQPYWADAGPQARSAVLSGTASLIEDRAPALAELLSREEGKPLNEAKGEVLRAAQIFSFFAGESLRNNGTILESVRPGMFVEMTHEPVGVVGIIAPWNFPIAIPAWKIAPALAFGNTVVFKPADLTPGCAWALTRILEEAGAPAGTVNLVMGPGSEVGAAITGSPELNALTFTGSQAVGHRIVSECAQRGVKVQCEMGGKNPLVVLDDADIEGAVEVAINGAYFSTGQRCTASSRLIVTEGIHDEFVAKVKERMYTLTVGDPLDAATIIGPVAHRAQLEGNLQYLEIARNEGGQVFGGGEVKLSTPGYYMDAALITETTSQMRVNQEEIFGPVASVIKVQDYEQALSIVNDVGYGLSAGICTSSLAKATDFKRRAQAGMVMVNAPTAGVDPHVSFGGWKGSSYGPREQGSAAREFYTRQKTSYTNPS